VGDHVVQGEADARYPWCSVGVELPGTGLGLIEPWPDHLVETPSLAGSTSRTPGGTNVEVVQYDQVQFTKPDRVLSGMGLDLGKTEQALAELREQGLA